MSNAITGDTGGQTNETFYAPGAPRALWVGIQLVQDAPVRAAR